MQIGICISNLQGYLYICGMIIRRAVHEIRELLEDFPVVAIIGPRQVGKSTLAKALEGDREILYIDLENPADRVRLGDPVLFFESNRDKLVVLDEIQFVPDLFPVIRSMADKYPENGRFLVLGSASPDLLKQSSETLAGRIAYVRLYPFSYAELENEPEFSWQQLLLRGGFPKSYLARNDSASLTWRNQFIQTFLQRDLATLGFNLNPAGMYNLWMMCAHYHGRILNHSSIGNSLGLSNNTIRNHLEILKGTFMVDVLQPWLPNLSKRLVKSPKLYISDCGILNALLSVRNFSDLLGNPIVGFAWEGLVLQTMRAQLPADWNIYYLSTAAQAEIDFIAIRGNQVLAIECKFSTSPALSRGAKELIKDLNLEEIIVVSPVENDFPMSVGVDVLSLKSFSARMGTKKYQ